MTDRPIIFSAPMVRALLDGRKTMTRRVLKPQPPLAPDWRIVDHDEDQVLWMGDAGTHCQARLPYAPGDRLWVREAWGVVQAYDDLSPKDIGMRHFYEGRYHCSIGYKTDPPSRWCQTGCNGAAGRWRPSIHMPRWASRLTLTVTEVKVERVQDISREDALAEGIYPQYPTAEDREWYRNWAPEQGIDPDAEPMDENPVWMAPGARQGWGATKAERDRDQWAPTPECAFRFLWDSLNAKRGFPWEANPWVVAVRFTVEQRNIDG